MNHKSILKQITKQKVDAYLEHLKKLDLSDSTVKRRLSSIRKFCDYAQKEGYLGENEISPRRSPTVRGISGLQSRIVASKIIKLCFSFTLVIILALLVSRRFFPSFPKISPKLPLPGQITTQTIATYSPWIVNFRGKLLSPGGEPITEEAKIIFKIYSQEKEDEPLWESKTWELEPNPEGEFQAPVGDTTRGDKELPSRLFFQNERLYLEVVVDNQTLTPRTPLSTAAHVSDSLNLGGFPPSQEPEGNMVPVLTQGGNLLLAASSPKIKSTQGTIALEGEAITLITPTGSDGNITLAPDGSGVLNLIFSGDEGNFVNAQNANLTQGALYYGEVASDTTGYNLLELASGSTPTSKFSVDAQGNVKAARLSSISGYYQDSGIFKIDQGGPDYFQIKKSGLTASVDSATVILDETGKTASGYDTLALSRKGGTTDAYALYISSGNARFAGNLRLGKSLTVDENLNLKGEATLGDSSTDTITITGSATVSGNLGLGGQLQLGRFNGTPTSMGTGALLYNTSDNLLYYDKSGSWSSVGGGLQEAYNVGNTITTTNARDIQFNLADTATDANFFVDLDGSGSVFAVRDNNNTNLFAVQRSNTLINASTRFGTLSIADLASGGDIGTAATTVDIYTSFNLAQTTSGQTITLPDPTDTTAGRLVYLSNTGTTTFTLYSSTVKVGDTTAAMWDGDSWNLAGGGGSLTQGTVNNSTLRWNSTASQWAENISVLSQTNPTTDGSHGLSVTNTGEVTGTGYAGYFSKTGASTTNVGLYAAASGGTNNYAAIFESGNVGIGTTTPGAALDVNGNLLVQGGGTIDTRAAGTLTIGGTTQTGLTLGRSGTTTSLVGSNFTAGGIGYGASNTLTFTSAGTSGQALLSAGAGAPTWGTLETTYGGTGQNFGSTAQGNILYFSGAGTMAALAPDTAGYLLQTGGAGANPSWVDISASGGPWTLSGNNLYPDSTDYNVAIGAADAGNADLYVNGNVGIGTTNPLAALSVGSSSQFQVNSSGAIAAATGITSSGDITFSTLNAGGIIKAAEGTGQLSIATAGTDYEYALTFTSGLTRLLNVVSLGGTLTQDTTLTQGNNAFTINNNGTANTIINLSSSGDFDIQDNGVSALFVRDDGLVGIGTTNPSARLENVGTTLLGSGLTGGEDALLVNVETGFSGNLLKLAVNGTQKLAIDSTGMLTTASGVFTSTVADAADAIGFKLITPAYTTAGAKLLSIWNDTNEKMSLDKDGILALYNSESMIYNSSGDITIDAASGNVSFATNDLINIDDLTMGGIASISGTPNLTLIPTSGLSKIYNLNDGDLGIYTSVGGDIGASEIIRITNSGNVGIGTTSPGAKLETAGTAWLRGAAGTTGLYVNSSGNVGIGTTDPGSYKLNVAGNVAFNSGDIYTDSDNFLYAARFVDTAGNNDYFLDPANVGTAGTFYGNVGIGGIVDPAEKLEVNGKIKIFDTALARGEIYSSSFSKLWTSNNNFNASGTSFSSGMLNPANNDELKLAAPTTLDNADTVANWTSSDSTNFAKSQDTTDKQEGTGSIKVVATAKNSVSNQYKYSIADSFLRQSAGDSNYGGYTDYHIRTLAGPIEYAMILKFNLSDIDSDSSISKADFSLNIINVAFGGLTAGCYRVTANWAEYGVTWNNKPGRAGNSGNIALTALGRRTVSLTSLVTSLINGTYANYGWIVSRASGTGDHRAEAETRESANDPRLIVSYVEPKALNDTLTRDLGAGGTKNLTGYSNVKFWIKSTRTDTYLQFGMGETAWDNNTWGITINSADTWEQKTIDISGISSANKDAIRYLGFKTTNADAGFTMKFDDVKATAADISGDQTWTSETQDAGAGQTHQPNRLTMSWALDGTDNIAPKIQLLGSSTGAFTGEEAIYPNGSGTYWQDGGTYDLDNGVEKDISPQMTTAYRYWKVKAYINTGTTLTDTPKIYDINLREYGGNLVLNPIAGNVGIGTTTPGYRLDVQDSQESSYVARIYNTDTATSADALLISLGVANASRTTGNYFIGFSDGAGTVAGKIQGGASAVAYTTTGTDLAEYFLIANLNQVPEVGELVTFDNQKARAVRKTEKQSDNPIGVVSTSPGFLGGGPLCQVEDQSCDESYEKSNVIVALIGQVPVKVSTKNGPIEVGDYLTSSNIPGVAMKAIKAGPIVGKALEPYNNPDPNNVGKITLFVNVGWYDPEIYLTSTGELSITGEELAENEEEAELNAKYNLKDSLGEIIQRIGIFSEAVIANLRAGRIETEELISPIIKSKEIETERLSLSELTPLADQDIVINLQQTLTDDQEASGSSFGRLIIKGKEGQEVVSIDSEGNASFSGELTTESLSVGEDASIAGTLYAEEIITKHGTFGDLIASSISATYITQNITNIYQNEASDSADSMATESANIFDEIDDIEALIAEILNTPIDTENEEFDEDIEIPTNGYVFENDLMVLGTTTLSDVNTTGSLNIGGTLSIADNSINTLYGPLYIQNLGLGGIDILAGKIIIDQSGNVVFGEDVTVEGSLFANTIRPLENQDLVIDLATIPVASESGIELPSEASESAFGKLLVKGFDGKTVASIDASGSAYFSSLDIEADYSATQSGALIAAYDNWDETGNYLPAIKTNATSGMGILPTNEEEIMIYNPKITDQSLIYITPISDTANKVLFVKSKQANIICEENKSECVNKDGWFKVAIDMAINQEIKFNWWIIN